MFSNIVILGWLIQGANTINYSNMILGRINRIKLKTSQIQEVKT